MDPGVAGSNPVFHPFFLMGGFLYCELSGNFKVCIKNQTRRHLAVVFAFLPDLHDFGCHVLG